MGRVDQSALRTNQVCIITLLVLAFVLDIPALVAGVGGALLLSAAYPPGGPFRLLYAKVLAPIGLIRPDVQEDEPAPHRFAQALGGTFTALAAVALWQGWTIVGWTLTWMVVALAALNLFAGVCVGCLLYAALHT
jgi:hypothetical protein